MKAPENLSHGGFATQKSPKDWIVADRIENIKSFLSPILKKNKNITYTSSSYGIKHAVERSLGYYISNGELILAMIQLGFDYKRPLGPESINCYFNVSTKSLRKIEEDKNV